MPGFFDRLRSMGSQQQPQQQPNNQQQQPLPGQGNRPQANSAPNQQHQTAGISNDPKSVLDSHADLYTPSTTTDNVPEFNLASDKLDGVVKSQDFMKDLDPAIMQRLQSGDMTALSDAMNHVGRNAYKAALTHGSTLTGKFVEARFGHADKGLDGRIKSSQLNDHLSRTPNFSNPVVKQQLTDIVTRLQQKHPDAPYEEVIEEGKRILGEVANSINPKTPDPKAAEATDWEDYMSN